MSDKPKMQNVEGRNPGELGQLNRQLDEAKVLREGQMQTVEQLQTALFGGDINQGQYDAAIGALFDAQLEQLRGDLTEQGRPEAAAGVPVGQGVADTIAEPTGDPNAEPVGVNFASPMREPEQPLTNEYEALVAGPTDRPWESRMSGVHQGRKTAVPSEVQQFMPYLLEAANSPDAPPALLELVKYLNYQMGR